MERTITYQTGTKYLLNNLIVPTYKYCTAALADSNKNKTFKLRFLISLAVYILVIKYLNLLQSLILKSV